jgi:hypothetical protein
MMWDKISGTVGGLFSGIGHAVGSAVGGFLGTGNAADGTASTKDVVRAMFASVGWTGAQWDAGDWVISHESGWNPRAQNPSSTASGLGQFIDGTWRAYRGGSSAAHMKDATIGEQGRAIAKYIGARYGNPIGAKSFWQAHNYYDKGGWLPPGLSTVWNATGRPEPVLTAAEHDGLLRWRHHNAGEQDHRDRERLMGDVHIHHERGNPGEIMDELWHRLRVARRGGVYSTNTVALVN